MDQQASDEDIMRQLMYGYESALGVLMERWAGPLRCFIDRMCGALRTTDDIHQEVWTRLFVYRHSYNSLMPFRGYLFKIAVNCCRTALRRESVARSHLLSFDHSSAQPEASQDPPIINALIDRENKALLHRAIASLPSGQRAVVLLYILFDTDYRRIADVLGRSAGTIRSNMHHALKKLRSTLNGMLKDSQGQVKHEIPAN